MFLRNCWYVFGWNYELADANPILGRVILGEPVVVWRDGAGALHAMQNRCPHRHSPLSLGRVEGNAIRCLYHGMLLDGTGTCVQMPCMDTPPPLKIRTYPVAEKYDWIWVWTGDPALADEALIPQAIGISDPDKPMRSGQIDYDAHYQLVHDNLCDLSHVDFLHATTLRPLTGARWSQTEPRITATPQGIHLERWFENADAPDGGSTLVDTWSTYDFVAPGIFVMHTGRYPEGTAARCGHGAPDGVEPINQIMEQQAVTPITEHRTAYFFASGVSGRKARLTPDVDTRINVVKATFEEDRRMIEAQQQIWNLTPASEKKHFMPQDKGPFAMRKVMERLINAENNATP